MLLAINLVVVDVPLGVLIVGIVLLLATAWWWFNERDLHLGEASSDEPETSLAIPFYVERDGLQNLGRTLKVELPIAREVTKQRKLVAKWRGIGGERERSETKQFSGDLDVAQFVRTLDDKLDYDACSRDLGDVPTIEGREVLAEAIAQLETTVGETSQTRELLRQVEAVYDRERAELIVKQKRSQLAEAGKGQKLLLLSGNFDMAVKLGDGRALIVLTHFDTPRYYRAYGSGPSDESEHEPVPVPNGVGIRVALPDDAAFTPAGKERLNRGEPFYARLIAHSPSFSDETGMLTCAAYALWGTNRPRPNREPPYAC